MAVDFKVKQAEFAAYIRDPLASPAPADVDPERMAVYRELFFNNIDGFLSSNFPVLRKICDEQQWQTLSQAFFKNHRCQTPYFSEIAEEFLAYLQQHDHADLFPFLLELAHYEWVEMALAIAQAEPRYADAALIAGLPHQQLSLSPLAWPLVYRYPVQRIGPDYLPQQPPAEPTCLIVYRDQDYQVHFLLSSPVTYRLLQIIAEHGALNGAQALQRLAAEFPQFDTVMLTEQGSKTLIDMAEKGIIVPADKL